MKKIMNIWICFLLVFYSLTPVFAKGQGAIGLEVSKDTLEAGDEIKVEVYLNENPGLVSMEFEIQYDQSMFTLMNVEDTGLIPGQLHPLNNLKLCPYKLTWANDTVTSNYTVTGKLVTLTFKVSDDIVPGTYEFKPSYQQNNFQFYDWEGNEYSPEVKGVSVEVKAPHVHEMEKVEEVAPSCTEPGSKEYYACDSCGKFYLDFAGNDEIEIEEIVIQPTGHDYDESGVCKDCGDQLPSYLIGDVNDDGTINGFDSIMLNRYNAGWDIEINLNAADINQDGSVNGFDSILLNRYNEGWEGIL